MNKIQGNKIIMTWINKYRYNIARVHHFPNTRTPKTTTACERAKTPTLVRTHNSLPIITTLATLLRDWKQTSIGEGQRRPLPYVSLVRGGLYKRTWSMYLSHPKLMQEICWKGLKDARGTMMAGGGKRREREEEERKKDRTRYSG